MRWRKNVMRPPPITEPIADRRNRDTNAEE
jgi:hypothetical protein